MKLEDNSQPETDADAFWNSVEQETIARGLTKANNTQFKVPLSYSDWAPYIGHASRRSNMLFNTEFEKVRPSQETPDVLDAISSEMVNHLMVKEKVHVYDIII